MVVRCAICMLITLTIRCAIINICNVKSQYMAMRLNDDNRVPLRINCQKSEASLQFLEDFGRFMREWLDSEIPATAKL